MVCGMIGGYAGARITIGPGITLRRPYTPSCPGDYTMETRTSSGLGNYTNEIMYAS